MSVANQIMAAHLEREAQAKRRRLAVFSLKGIAYLLQNGFLVRGRGIFPYTDDRRLVAGQWYIGGQALKHEKPGQVVKVPRMDLEGQEVLYRMPLVCVEVILKPIAEINKRELKEMGFRSFEELSTFGYSLLRWPNLELNPLILLERLKA